MLRSNSLKLTGEFTVNIAIEVLNILSGPFFNLPLSLQKYRLIKLIKATTCNINHLSKSAINDVS